MDLGSEITFSLGSNGDVYMHFKERSLDLGYTRPLTLVSLPWSLGARRGINIYNEYDIVEGELEPEVLDEKEELFEILTRSENDGLNFQGMYSGSNRRGYYLKTSEGLIFDPFGEYADLESPMVLDYPQSIALGRASMILLQREERSCFQTRVFCQMEELENKYEHFYMDFP